MKKLKIVAVVICILGLLSGCGKSEAAVVVDEKIKAIGSVSLDSEASITDAEQAYNALSEDEKKQVEGYETLTKAKDDYNKAVEEHEKQLEEEYKSQIEEANKKIEDLDMKGAYEIAVSLPEEYSKDKDEIIKVVDSKCYENTFIVKFANVVSELPKTTTDPERYTENVVIGHNYPNEQSMNSAFKEYFDYLNKYYTPIGDDLTSYKTALSSQSYQFEDENGHFIQISSANLLGFCSVNLAYDKSANFRDVIETADTTE